MPWIREGSYNVLQQTHAQSCGLCCVGMILNLKQGRMDAELSLAAMSRIIDPETEDHPAAYQRATRDRVGFVKMATAVADPAMIKMGEYRILRGEDAQDYGARESLGKGTASSHLQKVLNAYGVTSSSPASVKEAIRAGTRTNPTIVQIEVPPRPGLPHGGCHWVLVVGRQTRWGRESIYTILDPSGFVTQNHGSVNYTSRQWSGRFSVNPKNCLTIV